MVFRQTGQTGSFRRREPGAVRVTTSASSRVFTTANVWRYSPHRRHCSCSILIATDWRSRLSRAVTRESGIRAWCDRHDSHSGPRSLRSSSRMRPTLDTDRGSDGRPRVSSERRCSVRLLPGLRAAIALEATLPEIFLFAHVLGDPAAEDEEGVAQAIDIAQRPLAQRLHSRELDDPTLGPPADGARLVQKGVDAAASG